jgi:hypothetical protein
MYQLQIILYHIKDWLSILNKSLRTFTVFAACLLTTLALSFNTASLARTAALTFNTTKSLRTSALFFCATRTSG